VLPEFSITIAGPDGGITVRPGSTFRGRCWGWAFLLTGGAEVSDDRYPSRVIASTLIDTGAGGGLLRLD
jgi:hypothetical protein